MNNLNAWLRQFVKDNLNISDDEISLASKKYEEVDGILEGHTFLNGSRARHTAVKPLNDIDIFWVLDKKSEIFQKSLIGQDQIDIHKVLDDLEKHLTEHYRNTPAKIIKGEHSVGIYFYGNRDKFSADVVPAIPQDDGKFRIPKTAHMSVWKRRAYYQEAHNFDEIKWILSHPKAYIEECQHLDDLTDGNFRHAVRIVKSWRRSCKKADDSIKLKSFHLECVIAEIFKENRHFSCLDAVEYFFKNLETEFLQTPCIPDKAGGRNIDDYMVEDDEFSLSPIKPVLSSAQSIIDGIKNSHTEDELLALAKKLTLEPPRIPTHSATVDKVKASSRPYFIR